MALRTRRWLSELVGGPQISSAALRTCRQASDSYDGAPEESEAPRFCRRRSDLSGGLQNLAAARRKILSASEFVGGPQILAARLRSRRRLAGTFLETFPQNRPRRTAISGETAERQPGSPSPPRSRSARGVLEPPPRCFTGWTSFFARVRTERGTGRAVAFAILINPRSASLTALSLGKTLATFGSRTTILVSAAIRAAYLPRTMAPKSDRWYSGRNSSAALGLIFFMFAHVAGGLVRFPGESSRRRWVKL